MREIQQIYQALAAAYTELVDPSHLTFCAMTSEACRRVLAHFGVRAEVVACQMVATTPAGEFTVGFMGERRPGKWDGHAACVSDGWLFDGALRHVSVGLGLHLPPCVVAPRALDPAKGLIAARDLAEAGVTLRWTAPPLGYAARVPRQPKWIIKPLSARLITRVGILLKAGGL